MDIEHINQQLEIRQSNIITNARYEMSACELDLVFCILSQLKKGEEGKKYLLRVKDISTITDRKWNYQQLRDATYNLISRVYEYTNDDGNLIQVSLFSSCEYINGQGVIKVEISDLMRPHLFDLKERFTSFRLLASLNMSSKHAKRIYLLCSQWKDIGVLKMSIEDLKYKLHFKDPKGKQKELYKQIGELKKRVLNPAMDEINEHTELTVKYDLIKGGRAFKDIIFTIDVKNKVSVSTPSLNFKEDLEAQKIRKILEEIGVKRNDIIQQVTQDKELHKIVHKWLYDYKLGHYSHVKNPAGHLLVTLGLT